MKKMCSIFICIALIICSCSIAMAYELLGGKLRNGVSNIEYYVDSTASTHSSRITTAANGWVNATNSPISMSKVTSNSSSEIDISMVNITDGEEKDWIAWTSNSQNDGSDWSYSYVYLNEPWYAKIGSTAFTASIAHELGHSMGLAENNSVKNSIMCQYSKGRTANSPKTDDINGINYLY